MYVIFMDGIVITVGCNPTVLNIDDTLTPSAFNRNWVVRECIQ